MLLGMGIAALSLSTVAFIASRRHHVNYTNSLKERANG